MEKVYTFVRSSSLINYDVNEHRQDYNGEFYDSKLVGMVTPENYKEIVKNGFDKKYLMRGEK